MEFNVGEVFSAVAAAVPDRECLVFRERRFTYAQLEARSNRLANFLVDHGIAVPRDRTDLRPWESGQDHVAIYSYNGNEYLEAMLAAFKARAVPANVNYRYVEAELLYLLRDMKPRVVVVSSTFAPTLAAVLPQVPTIEMILQIDDGSGHEPLPGAVDYEAALAGASPGPAPTEPEPDDLYILYTGGTTGMPRGVVWRQADFFVVCLGGRNLVMGREFESLAEITAAAFAAGSSRTIMPLPPFMHAGGHWTALGGLHSGHRVVIQSCVDRLDPADVWQCVEREKVTQLFLVGEAFGRPLYKELAAGRYDVASLQAIGTGGAVFSAALKGEFLECLPAITLSEFGGASESGGQLANVSSRALGVTAGTFIPSPVTCVIDETRTRALQPGHEGLGWLASAGRLPLGYLNDEVKTAETFPVVAGQRMTVPGDRARHLADGQIELLGREAMTINSGGEKIFAEEVEKALLQHPAIFDALVCSRPSERWGEEVVALVQLQPGAGVTDEELLVEVASHVARYKLPKAILRREIIVRSPTGKADYRWAREQAAGGPSVSASSPAQHDGGRP